jgi:hypothetical protein
VISVPTAPISPDGHFLLDRQTSVPCQLTLDVDEPVRSCSCYGLDGTVSGGTVVAGTVTGPPKPWLLVGPELVEGRLPALLVRSSKTSRVPVFWVVTKPALGLEMLQSAKVIGISART